MAFQRVQRLSEEEKPRCSETLSQSIVISKYVSVRAQISGIRAIQYLRLIVLPRPACLFGRQNAGRRGELRSRNLSTHRAGRHTHLRIVANALGLPHVAARHHVKLAVCFAEPHGSRNARSGFAKSGQRNIFLTMNGGGIWLGMGSILEVTERKVASGIGLSCHLWFGTRLLRSGHLCYKPEHA